MIFEVKFIYKNMKAFSISKSILKFTFGLITFFIMLEVTSKIVAYFGYGYLKKPSEIISDDNLNIYIQDLERVSKCTYFNNLFPHPYLGWVHWNNPECPGPLVNSDGFTGPEFPIKNDENFFDILITGGSVAQQFGPGECKNKKNNFCRDFLSEALEKYKSMNNQNIRVFNAGAGAYKHPHQSIVATLFGKSFDLIISIEGFNEHHMLNDKVLKKLSYPANNFNVSTNDFYIDSHFNKYLLRFLLFYKNLPNKFDLIDNSHFHALSYRFLKKIFEFTFLSNTKKRENFSNLWKYKKSELENINIDEFKYKNLISHWKNFIASSNSNGAESIIIIQPVPQLFKNLSDTEKQITNHRDYRKIFLRMSEEAKKLRVNENLMIYDFLNIFQKYNESIYKDAMHINAKGNEIMALNLKDILVSNKLIKKIN